VFHFVRRRETENRVLRGKFGDNKVEVIGGWGK
jgi:hypothetical protein